MDKISNDDLYDMVINQYGNLSDLMENGNVNPKQFEDKNLARKWKESLSLLEKIRGYLKNNT